MADKDATSLAIEGADVIAPVTTEPKKQHAPRQKKAVAEGSSSAETVKSPRKKRGASSTEATTGVKTSAIGKNKLGKGRKGVAKAQAVRPAEAAASVAVAARDEFADLIALEEENKALRNALSENFGLKTLICAKSLDNLIFDWRRAVASSISVPISSNDINLPGFAHTR